MTEYIVLGHLTEDTGAEGWFEHARVSARSSNSAIQKALADESDGGTFVAVPARSWKPVTVKVETKTALKFS